MVNRSVEVLAGRRNNPREGGTGVDTVQVTPIDRFITHRNN